MMTILLIQLKPSTGSETSWGETSRGEPVVHVR